MSQYGIQEPVEESGKGLGKSAQVDADNYFKKDYLPLVAFLRYQGASRETAEDVAMEVMFTMMTKWETINEREPYARRAAMRIFLRGKKRVDAREKEYDPERHDGQDGTDVIGEATTRQGVAELLQHLPLRQRHIMAHFVSATWTAVEIAEVTGMKPSTVRSNLRHAQKTLKAFIEERKEDWEWASPVTTATPNVTQNATPTSEIPNCGSSLTAPPRPS